MGEERMTIIGTIEARMGSTRTPGKTLIEIFDGISLLGAVCKRFQLCRNIDDVYVATTVEPKDDAIALWCERNSVRYHRGSENNVLDRVVQTALTAGADAIVQMGADSAYLDFELIDYLVSLYRSGSFDYVCNDLELTYPLGIYGHVVRVATLASLNAKDDLTDNDREDVVRYIWEHPQTYGILNITAPPALAYPGLRLTVDYPEDVEQARDIYIKLGRFDFTTSDVVDLYRREPEVFEKTMKLVQKSAPFLRSRPDE
jgi:spore coat polysaccharide biosynthesis protein SpsF